VARRWGYEVKGVPEDQAQIVVVTNNFHGRTTTVISFSNDHVARRGFGPFTPGFVAVPFGDADALAGAISPRTVAVLLEPVQGEADVFVPPAGYLAAVRRICTDSRVLLLADEIQSGLGRCGTTFACERENVVPDVSRPCSDSGQRQPESSARARGDASPAEGPRGDGGPTRYVALQSWEQALC
jgi:ornithine--oxo-acid transaminase